MRKTWHGERRPRRCGAGPRPGSCLALAELELLASLRTARLLALHRAGVARQEAEVAKLAAVPLVDLHEGAGDGETERAGLAGLPAPLHVRLHVVLAERVGRRERLLDGRDERRPREVVAERAPVDVPLARARLQVDSADGFLAAADGVRGRVGHATSPRSCRRSGAAAAAPRADARGRRRRAACGAVPAGRGRSSGACRTRPSRSRARGAWRSWSRTA